MRGTARRLKPRAGSKARGRPTRGSSAALTREKIVKAALKIVDRDGLSALSMRHLGAQLGVDPMAIYYHLPNKAALYDAIVEAVTAETDVGSASGPASAADAPPVEQLRQMAFSYRDALLAHPNALPVVAARPVRTPAFLRPIERMFAVIARLGFTPQESMAIVNVCGHYIMGWAQTYAAHLQGSEIHDHGPLQMDELPPEEFPYLHRVMAERALDNRFAVEFELGINAILNGLLASRRR